MRVHFSEQLFGGCQIASTERRSSAIGQEVITPKVDAARLPDVDTVEYGLQTLLVIRGQHDHGS